ncbi:hypothetical protein HDU99_005481, partial [Rhizoclosmatium hyalinum]
MNRFFFIRRKNDAAVKVGTHLDSRHTLREWPLEDVADIVAAFKMAIVPRFDSTPIDELSLHQVVDGVEGPALRPGLPLTEVTGGRTDDYPLIVKSKRTPNTNIHRNTTKIAIAVIQKKIAELQVTSPLQSDTEIGIRTLNVVKEYKNFYVHVHDPQKVPLLTSAEYDRFQSIKWKEAEFQVKMMEIFQIALGPDVNLVKSNEGKTNMREVECDTNDTIFHYGVPPEKLWDMICILEGKVVCYLQHMEEFSSAVLFDRKRCWLVRSREKKVIASVEEVSWNVGGSKEKFVTF